MSFDDELSSAPPTNSRVASPLSQQQQPAYSSAAPARAPAPAPSSAPQKQAAPVSAPVVSVQATNTEEVLLSQLRTNVCTVDILFYWCGCNLILTRLLNLLTMFLS